MLLTGCQDGTAQLWEAATGKPLGEPLRQHDPVIALAFGRGSTFVIARGHSRTEKKKTYHRGEVQFGKAPVLLPGGLDRLKLWLQVNTGKELDPEDLAVDLDREGLRQRWQKLQKRGGPPEMKG
jgi:hypothetical protein